jgi:hypothetical protein
VKVQKLEFFNRFFEASLLKREDMIGYEKAEIQLLEERTGISFPDSFRQILLFCGKQGIYDFIDFECDLEMLVPGTVSMKRSMIEEKVLDFEIFTVFGFAILYNSYGNFVFYLLNSTELEPEIYEWCEGGQDYKKHHNIIEFLKEKSQISYEFQLKKRNYSTET